jgi:hypothetical protein
MSASAEEKLAYAAHRSSARQRGIGFGLTFDEWRSIWGDKFGKRGRSGDQYQMCRTGDAGPYAVGNVRIDTKRANRQEHTVISRQAAMQEAWDFDGEDRSGCADWLDNRRDMGYF